MNNTLLLAGRTLLGFLLLACGSGKLGQPDHLALMLAQISLPVPHLMAYLIGMCEFVAGIAFLIGFQARTIAALLAIGCLLAGFMMYLISGTAEVASVFLLG